MTRIKAVFVRVAIFGFALISAFYSLYTSSMGRLNNHMEAPAGFVQSISEILSSLGRIGIAEMISRLKPLDFLMAGLLFILIFLCGELCLQGKSHAKLRRYTLKLITPLLLLGVAFWVIFSLNNTSLFAFNNFLQGNEEYPLFGSARRIRADEFALWTPMALSQEQLGWPAINTLMGNGTDVTWVSMGGLPAWSAATIFKPLYWAFLLLGNERGLSFLCISRLILLFWVSRRTALLYTKGNQSMSIAAAMILTLSPMVQWFISQSIAEVLIFGQGMVLAMHRMLNSKTFKGKIAYGLLNGWMLGCLVLVGYPAWIIPMVYLVLATGIFLFVHTTKDHRRSGIKALLIGLLPSLTLLGLVVYFSWDTLQAVRLSSYPGGRLITGGLSDGVTITGSVWNSAFKTDLASLFFPLETMEFNFSNCVDSSTFLGFAPAGIVLSIAHQWRNRKADPFSIIISAILAFFWLFTFVQLPAWFCKLTLLSQCSRPVFPIGICEVILLIRARSQGGIHDPRLAVLLAVASTAFNLFCISYAGLVRPTTPQLLILAMLYLFIFLMLYLDFQHSGKRLTAFFLCCILLLAGGFVNPVQQGLDMLDEFDLVSALRSIENKPEDLYALEGGYPLSNVPLMVGKHCINTDQAYADMDRWSVIDPEGKYREVYNRLCHVGIELVDSEEEMTMWEEGNYIYLRLTRDNLAALGVNYLITPRSFVSNADLVSRVESDELYIWKLN